MMFACTRTKNCISSPDGSITTTLTNDEVLLEKDGKVILKVLTHSKGYTVRLLTSGNPSVNIEMANGDEVPRAVLLKHRRQDGTLYTSGYDALGNSLKRSEGPGSAQDSQ